MIKNIFLLNIKALGANFFKSNKKSTKNSSKVKSGLFTLLILYLLVTFLGMFFAFFDFIIEPLFTANLGWLFFALIGISVFSLSVISTIFMAHSSLFSAKDNDLLLAMPIKPSNILIGRLLVLLMLDYGFLALVSAPAIYVWFSYGYATVLGLIFLIIGLLVLPLISMAVSLFFAWLLALILNRLRYKNVFSLIFSVGFLAAYFWATANAQGLITKFVEKGEEIATAFRKALPPFYYFGDSVANENLLSCFLFLAIALILFGIAIYLLSINYRKILATNKGQVKAVYKEKLRKESSPLKSIVKKELARFWSVPGVVLNTSLGSVLILILAGVVAVKQVYILTLLEGFKNLLGEMPVVFLLSCSICFLSTTNNLSASLISLEGKNFWILKSAPINSKTILNGKLLAHLIVAGLPCLIATLITSFIFATNVTQFVIAFLLPVVFTVLVAIVGLVLNLNFPKFDWINEVYLVKQSLSAMLALLGSMFFVVAFVMIYRFWLSDFITITFYLAIAIAFFVVVSCLLYYWILKSGVKKFEEM